MNLQQHWQDLLDKDDRTSPAEYPDMALITKDELAAIVAAECEVTRLGEVEAENDRLRAALTEIRDNLNTSWQTRTAEQIAADALAAQAVAGSEGVRPLPYASHQ